MQFRVRAARLHVATASALAAVLALAALVRAVSYLQVRHGSIPFLHLVEGTDMRYYDGWARQIAAGDILAAPRPYGPWHHAVAREAHERTSPGQPFDESVGRAMWGRWIGEGRFYRDALYPYVLAASHRVLGPHLAPVLAWQALLGLATVALVFAVARTMWDQATAVAAGTLAAMYAPFVFFESALLEATLVAFLTLAAVAAATVAARRESPWAWTGAGCAAGLAVLAHSAGLLLAAALPLAMRGRRGPCMAAYAGGLALALSPLVARNAAQGQTPWPAGTSAAYAAHAFVTGHAGDADPARGFPASPSEGRIFAATDARLLPTAWRTLATHRNPLGWLGLMGRKLLAFLDGWEGAGSVSFYYFLAQSPVLASVGVRLGLLLPLAALGFAMAAQGERSSRPARLASPAALAVACGLLTALVFFTSSRTRLAAAAAMLPFAGAGLVGAARRVRARQWRSLAAPATAAVIAAVIAAAPWWPREHLVRDADYRTGNALAVARWQHERQIGRPARGLRVLEKQLSTEPRPLRSATLGTARAVPEWAARVAGSFAELHQAAAAAQREAGSEGRALAHAEHAKTLAIVARGHAARARG
jgi:4-amino-4-deoxy-L-arabinose transferase-like glycosyltransferase